MLGHRTKFIVSGPRPHLKTPPLHAFLIPGQRSPRMRSATSWLMAKVCWFAVSIAGGFHTILPWTIMVVGRVLFARGSLCWNPWWNCWSTICKHVPFRLSRGIQRAAIFCLGGEQAVRPFSAMQPRRRRLHVAMRTGSAIWRRSSRCISI